MMTLAGEVTWGTGRAAAVFTSTEWLALAGFLALHHPVYHRRTQKTITYRVRPREICADCPTWQTGGSDRRSVLARQHEHRNLPRGPGLEFADGRASATSFGHSPARPVSSGSSASTVNVWVPTSALILEFALR